MKTNCIALLILLCFTSGFSQIPTRQTVQKERLMKAKTLYEVSPEVWRILSLPQPEKNTVNQLSSVDKYKAYYIYPQLYNYNTVVEFISVEIITVSNGRVQSAVGTSDQLTREQMQILASADLGTDVRVKMEFRPKGKTESKTRRANFLVTVVPATEAVYPGGLQRVTDYLIKSVTDKMPGKPTLEKVQEAAVEFVVDEQGWVVGFKVIRTSSDAQIDRLLMEAMRTMPSWKPARNGDGILVRQSFRIALGYEGC